MYKIILKEKEYFMPQNWSEVTFAKLLKLKELKFNQTDGNILSTSLTIGALMEIDHKEIMKLHSNDFISLANATKWVHTFDVEPKFQREFEFDGVKYMLVPDFNDITMGEAASIEQFSIEGVEKNTDKILAILIREVGIDGNIVEFDASTLAKRTEILKNNLTIPLVHGISTFFLDGRKTSSPITADSSVGMKIQIQEMTKE